MMAARRAVFIYVAPLVLISLRATTHAPAVTKRCVFAVVPRLRSGEGVDLVVAGRATELRHR